MMKVSPLTFCSHDSSLLQCFTLHRTNPNNPFLAPLPPIPSPVVGSVYIVLGPTIYVLGGSIHDIPSPNIWLLNCWLRGPSMHISHEFSTAGVLHGKICILDGCVIDTWSRSANWVEVLDPATGQWERVANSMEVREKWMHSNTVVGE
ncbi:hypothetical protein JHK82_048388 [Glycine max]|nr:hypothetical protein JHK82_048388 [Glycine max]